MSQFNLKCNNFDLIRLFAATQVVLSHSIVHLKLDLPNLLLFLSMFPGVPIFFIVSGFLISASFDRNSNLKEYLINRALRIFPGLWVCLGVSVLIAIVFGGVHFPLQSVLWLTAQLTIAQFYNPDFLRGFGTGALNGSLWSIPVELQFYAVLPLLYWLMKKWSSNWTILLFFVVSLILNRWIYSLSPTDYPYLKYIIVTILPHLFIFLLGILLQKYFDYIKKYLIGAWIYWALIYISLFFLANYIGVTAGGRSINPVSAIFLACFVLSAAFSLPRLSEVVLKGNDVSYGVYIYHMPVVNVLVHYGMTGKVSSLLVVISIVSILAWLSWKLVERPSMKLKRHPLHKIDVLEGKTK